MANCSEMKVGDVFVCPNCGLELQVKTTCGCEPEKQGSCSVPLQCCGREMIKK